MLVSGSIFYSSIIILFFLIGITIGWNIREYMMNYQDRPKLHPEFYDKNGNIIPDEVLAISFNPDYFDDDDSDSIDED